jgi:dihydrofolate synthase/folylpolyglutamate synthase
MNPARRGIYLQNLQRFGVKLGLQNIGAVLAACGDPQRRFPSVHVAGTNGKGSVCAMLASILKADGRRVGLYTSPHLADVRERIRIDGRSISAADFDRLLGRIRRTIERLLAAGRLEAHPTYFEVLTILAFLYFAERKVDIAVLEVGMGGRFDATNIVTPMVSVITSISLDHREYLGHTVAAIAFEKAGIIKPGVPVVSGVERGAAAAVIRRRARELGAPLVRAFGRDGTLFAARTAGGFRFRYDFCGEPFAFRLKLRGRHQGENAAVAIAAARTLGCVWKPFDRRVILSGLAAAEWPGRLEAVGRRPLVLLDGAHNEDGARALAAYVRDFVGGPLVLIFAMLKDKAVGRAAGLLFPHPDMIVLTSIPSPRAASPEEILKIAAPFRSKIRIEPDLRAAIALARSQAGSKGTVLVAGSLYLIGEVKKLPRRVFTGKKR